MISQKHSTVKQRAQSKKLTAGVMRRNYEIDCNCDSQLRPRHCRYDEIDLLNVAQNGYMFAAAARIDLFFSFF